MRSLEEDTIETSFGWWMWELVKKLCKPERIGPSGLKDLESCQLNLRV